MSNRLQVQTSERFRLGARHRLFVDSEIGRGGEIRTPDPHNPIVVRYQAALRPDRQRCYGERGNDTCRRVLVKGLLSAAESSKSVQVRCVTV